MICGLPVLACESGGPTETIVPFPPSVEFVDAQTLHPKPTGFLAAPIADAFSSSLLRIIRLSPSERAELALAARTRAKEHFGMDAMSASIEEVLKEAVNKGKVKKLLEKRQISKYAFERIQAGITVLCLLAVVLVYFDLL